MFKDKDLCLFARNIGNKYGKSIINSKNPKKYLMLVNL